ncbi:MAG: two-component system, OmpR family, phosphate regulon sensor histidine kinase PhoR [Chloroflexota bacterium]|jgi:signal transduction histidine kinase|nr:two-component system, OmpR family, phosphate regulon sensor histidine kinase PhoR [Chloroflexota bacterium]
MERGELTVRIAALEAELARINEEARREADAMFAQYQLSQVLASGGDPTALAQAVCAELVRLCGAESVGMWLSRPGGESFELAGLAGPRPASAPDRFADRGDADAWAATQAGALTVTLVEGRPAGIVVAVPAAGRGLDRAGVRILELARHELAVAFRNAQLRATLELERLELTAIIDGATDAIIEVDAERRILRLNRAALELLDELPEDAVGRTCGDALQCARAGGHAEESCPLAEVIRTGQAIRLRTTALMGAGGEVIPMVAGYARVAGSDGPRATAILRDMRDVRALDELREGFVATVSHELRTPLALVKGYAESLLLLELDPAERRRYLERIDQLADRLRTLVTEILDVTQLQAHPLVLERTTVPLAALVTRLSADLAISGGAERLQVELPADLPAVEVDPIRLSQVLENLVGNAAKYAPGTGAIRLSAVADPPGWLTVEIEDRGIGIPAADRGLVFEPFHRARNVRESSIAGTGLGLAISRRIVEAHGGRLWLEPRSDGSPGTWARFTLPLARTRRRTGPSAVRAPGVVPPGDGPARTVQRRSGSPRG